MEQENEDAGEQHKAGEMTNPPHEHDWMLVISTELEKNLKLPVKPWDQKVCRTCGRAEYRDDENELWSPIRSELFVRNGNYDGFYFLWARRMSMLVNSIRLVE